MPMKFINKNEYEEILSKIENSNAKEIEIYTDGSCTIAKGNKGTHALVIIVNDRVIYSHSDHNVPTTNNREEMFAIIKATFIAEYIINNTSLKVKIFTDSNYAKNVLFGKWKAKKNIEIINNFKSDLKKMKIDKSRLTVIHVKGHSGNYGNEIVDALCTEEYCKFNNEKNKY